MAADQEPAAGATDAVARGSRGVGGLATVERPAVPRATGPADAAFSRLVVPEVDVLLRVATALTGNVADAEDLVQDTLIRAYRGIHRFDGTHPRAWLLTILRNTHVNRNRRRRPVLLRDPETTLRLVARTRSDGAATPEEVVVGAQLGSLVGAAFGALARPHQQVVWLVDVEGFSYADTAHLLGIPRGTVMSRLHRARTRIRVRLAAAGPAPGPARP